MALVPYVIEQTSKGERSYDIYSVLLYGNSLHGNSLRKIIDHLFLLCLDHCLGDVHLGSRNDRLDHGLFFLFFCFFFLLLFQIFLYALFIFEVTDEEFDKEMETMAEVYQMEVDKIREMLGEKEQNNIPYWPPCRYRQLTRHI